MNCEVYQVIHVFFLKWLVAHKPTKFYLFTLDGDKANFSFTVWEAMPHKADELHVKEMDNLLRLLLIC